MQGKNALASKLSMNTPACIQNVWRNKVAMIVASFTVSLTLSACSPSAENVVQAQAFFTTSELAQAKKDFSAHWLAANLILLPKKQSEQSADLALVRFDQPNNIAKLTAVAMPQWVLAQHPHLVEFQAFKHELSTQESKQWLKSALMVMAKNSNAKISHVSYVQTGEVIDDLYTAGANDANEVQDLGAVIKGESIQFKLWAPTAQQVKVQLFSTNASDAHADKKAIEEVALVEDSHTGIWSVNVKASAEIYYQYQVTVYHPKTEKVETINITDPYSLSLSVNSEYSQVVDLSASNTMPKGWLTQADNLVKNPEDNIFYETHIRDFSAHDDSLSDHAQQGKYGAFDERKVGNSTGINYLKALREAGINNIHLLPTFDLGTINEDHQKVIALSDPISKVCQQLTIAELCEQNIDQSQSIHSYLSTLPTDEPTIQKIVSDMREFDNYNWGYDPFHYTVPEGSYAANPEGVARIIEFREMVQAIHNLGFRVIMDVVYNHTHQAGMSSTAVLDKIVPNYYHRLNPFTGEIEQSTCCDNTATERKMMEKLMIDSLVVWARDYKIDGFRFDLMAHQPKDAMLRAREAVKAVDPDNYFYGEGWNFGEVANNQRFVQASQLELGGTEIGTFTDRLRDAVRGGAFNAVGEGHRRSQGIGNGRGTIPNELQTDDLSQYYLMMDQIRVGLAGNLANFPLENAQGEKVTGKQIPYGDQPTGYALDPADIINYVSKHDNQALWDNNQYRIAYHVSTHDRVRMQLQSLAFPIFAQGIPFLHMGSELLRSKSFLRDSYDYSDWFNKVDFAMQGNNYNVGLPPRDKDEANWTMIKEVLKNNEGRDHVSAEDIQFSAQVFMDLIKIRMSSELFRLTNETDIMQRITFQNTGPNQQLGLIAMRLNGFGKQPSIMVIFNTSDETKVQPFKGAAQYQLHAVQQQGVDQRVKQSATSAKGFSVPPLTTAVFVEQLSVKH